MNYKTAILGLVLLAGSITAIVFDKMTWYMGVFFIIFSAFKLIDVKGFAIGFQKYDLIAKRSKVYAHVYPFLELLLGIGYVVGIWLTVVNVVTIIIMGVGAIGVGIALKKKQDFTCACLGTKLGIPLTFVTLFENIIMVIMAMMLLI